MLQSTLQTLKSKIPPKHLRRLQLVAANSLNQLLLITFSPLLSFMVIRLTSLELWGAFIDVMIVVQLGAHIVGWGNKEYLLRAFSRSPAGITPTWQHSLRARLPFLPLLWILLALLYPLSQLPLLILWSIGLFLIQSHDVFIVYKKDFTLAAIIELLTILALLTTVLLLGPALTLTHLILLFTLSNLTKGTIYTYRYRASTIRGQSPVSSLQSPVSSLQSPVSSLQSPVSSLQSPPHTPPYPLPTTHYLKSALPFFLLSFSGMLQTRIDLYAVNIFLTDRDVAQYQIFINFMIYLQTIAGFILIPFVKTIYRLHHTTIRKISLRLFAFGLLIILPALYTVRLLLTTLYEIDLPLTHYLWGGLYVLPLYYFLPTIYALYKAERQNLVIAVNLTGIILNAGLDILLLPRLGTEGAILAAAAVNWLVFLIYFRASTTLTTQD